MTLRSSLPTLILIILFITQSHPMVLKNLQPFIPMAIIIKILNQAIQSYHHLECHHCYLQFIQYLHPLDITLPCHLLYRLIINPIFILTYLIISSLV